MIPAYLPMTKAEIKRVLNKQDGNLRLMSVRGPARLRDVLGMNDSIIVHGGVRKKWHGVLSRTSEGYELV